MADVMLEAARRDAAACLALINIPDIHDSMVGFHAQQVVEKSIKAALFKHGVMVPKTHNIALLLDTLPQAGIAAPPHADVLDMLNPYAVAARYGALDVGPLDRAITAKWVAAVLAWAASLCAA